MVATFVTTYKGTKLHVIKRKRNIEKEEKQRGKTKYYK